MTRRIEASAPGKVVLSGEYAVLNGAPAICMAINRRATVTIEETDDEHHVVTAPGHVEEPRRFMVRDGVFGWLDSSDEFELLEAIWRRVGITKQGGLSLRLDTSGFLDAASGNKTGIGSSAALAVALAYALSELAPGEMDPVTAAHEGHLDFQGRLGSGVDIMTSAMGGVVQYEMKGRTVTGLQVPDGLESRIFWSGSPARTGKKLERLSSHGPKPSKAALAVSARRVANAWAGGSVDDLLRRFRVYLQVLQEFDADHELGIFEAGHAEMAAVAANAGLIYKPCGAGGGDIGILLADTAAHADQFIAAGLLGGFKVLDLQIDEQGATVETR